MKQTLAPEERIIVAADVPNLPAFHQLTDALAGQCQFIKVGLELITAVGGPLIVSVAHNAGLKVMYDGKFHDIPATMASASHQVAEMGVQMFTIHASCGLEGIKAAAQQAGTSEVIGVTVLTSLGEEESRHVYHIGPDMKVLNFVQDLMRCGVHSVVCSPQEIELLRKRIPDDKLQLITPGIRPAWSAANDQNRVMTPMQALKVGVDRMVIGRPITQHAGGPAEGWKRVLDEVQQALA